MTAYLRRLLDLLEKRPVGVFQIISYVYSYVHILCILPDIRYAMECDQQQLGSEVNINLNPVSSLAWSSPA